MTQQILPALPLPVLTFLLCAALMMLTARLDLGSAKARFFFAALFALFGFQALLVALRFGYGIDRFVLLQGVLPLFAGPVMYLGFASLATPADRFASQSALHLGLAVLVALGFSLFSGRLTLLGLSIDWAIAASYLAYAVALVRLWRKGADHLIHARLDLADRILDWMLRGAGLLVALMLLDTAIALSFALHRSQYASSMISYGSALLIIVLMATIIALPPLVAPRQTRIKPAVPADDDSAALESATRELLLTSKLYLDPDLSVQRLAKRLHVPVRSLSLAINQSQGINVSHYVNGFRLAHAATLLRTSSDSVEKVMTQSGFLTRSNFYREFQRVHGQSPAAYREGGNQDAP